MEIHRSSLIYSPRNKSPHPVGKIQRAKKEIPQETKPGVRVTFTKKTDSSKSDTLTIIEQTLKQAGTKPVLSSFQVDAITNQPINIRIQKALNAYSTEQNQIPQDSSIHIISGVDYIV